ncbi:ATP-binding protein [Amycolatopsis sp. CA-126428]|uniref:ATP-binding protein n=1 Tax=Amycolatopsis sp. CA-126428 TaxID=2073158 RepID=UPI0011B067EE|nr:ATP-binding protein [Amycolatopsis sp. CA-126428]
MNAPTQVHGELPLQAEIPRMREQPRFEASLDLVALPTAVPVARMFIADTLRRWHALFIEEHMEAVAVELVSLAVAATGPVEGTSWSALTELKPIRLRLLGYQRHIVFEVIDTDPEPLELADDAPSGSGFGLICALASRWGSTITPRGRVNWAELAVYQRTAAGLPRRPSTPSPEPLASTVETPYDHDILQRIHEGLERL